MLVGSLVALVTPMTANGDVDYAALEALVEWHVESGTDGIVAVGTTGESATLDFDDHIEVVKKVVEYAKGRIKVIAGAGGNATDEAIFLTKSFQDIGVDACLSVTPYYNKPTQEGLYQHFKAIAESCSVPTILYNVPGRTAVDMLPETVIRLAKLSNIIGIKEATGDLSRVKAILDNVDSDFLLFSGDDGTGLEFMKLGGHGVISVTNNVAPKEVADMCRAVREGRVAEAEAIDADLQTVHSAMFVESNPIPVKWALWRMDRIASPVLRLPLTTLTDQHHAQVEAALEKAGLLN